MTAKEALATLKSLGRPQIAAIYKRHGSGNNVFGVVTGEIGKLKKKIKINHQLANELWNTGNAEARILALQVTDPRQITRSDAERLLANGQGRFLGTYLCDLIAQSPVAAEAMLAWMKAKDEYTAEMGYGVLSSRLKYDPNSVSDTDAKKILSTIEKEIHGAPNWARYSMNSAMIAIGVFKPALATVAIETAKRIGKVEVDHGETSCKTPDAAPYIERGRKHKPSP